MRTGRTWTASYFTYYSSSGRLHWPWQMSLPSSWVGGTAIPIYLSGQVCLGNWRVHQQSHLNCKCPHAQQQQTRCYSLFNVLYKFLAHWQGFLQSLSAWGASHVSVNNGLCFVPPPTWTTWWDTPPPGQTTFIILERCWVSSRRPGSWQMQWNASWGWPRNSTTSARSKLKPQGKKVKANRILLTLYV